jgi:hypothetical protein
MIAMRRLLLFSCLALLSGCAAGATATCPAPGGPSAGHLSCVYLLKVTDIKAGHNLVEAEDLTGNVHIFRVVDLGILKNTNQLEVSKDYVFSSNSNSSYLELFPQAIQSKIKSTLNTICLKEEVAKCEF